MSVRPSRPLAGVTASQLWANSLDAGELIDKLDADNQKALADLDFCGADPETTFLLLLDE